jgi:hypothetical protein
MNKAWHYSDGKWTLGDDPMLDLLLDVQVTDKHFGPDDALRALGYEQLLSVGNRWQAGFELYECEDGSALIITGEDEDTRCFYVAAAPDARDICARWAGLTRDKMIMDTFNDLTGNDTQFDVTRDAISRIKSLLRKPE